MRYIKFLYSLLFLIIFQTVSAQEPIELLDGAEKMEYDSEIGDIVRLKGNVGFRQKGNVLHTDSANYNMGANFFEAFGNVTMNQEDGSTSTADYMRYDGATKLVEMIGNVRVNNNGTSLNAPYVQYNTLNKVGKYSGGGTVYGNGEFNSVSSTFGTYNGNSGVMLLEGDAVVVGRDYTIRSNRIDYNMNNKMVYMHGATTIQQQDHTVTCQNGWYDSQRGIGDFTGNASVISNGQTLRGQQLTYNKDKGFAVARNNVQMLDDARGIETNSQYGEFYQKDGKAILKGNVRVKNKRDNVDITTDYGEFYNNGSAKMKGNVVVVNHNDNVKIESDAANFNNDKGEAILNGNVVMNSYKDSTKITGQYAEIYNKESRIVVDKMVYIEDRKQNIFVKGDHADLNNKAGTTLVYEHVQLIKVDSPEDSLFLESDTLYTYTEKIDSLTSYKHLLAKKNVAFATKDIKGLCDTLHYSYKDSTLQLYHSPILWLENTQLTADFIQINTIHNKPATVWLRKNSFVIQEIEPSIYNQLKGTNIDAYIQQDTMRKVSIMHNAQSIYYAKETVDSSTTTNNSYMGMNKAEADNMYMYFQVNKVRKVTFIKSPIGVMYPLKDVTPEESRLPDFQWHSDKKPQLNAQNWHFW